jgi:ubiquitin C-terminal hydrolase
VAPPLEKNVVQPGNKAYHPNNVTSQRQYLANQAAEASSLPNSTHERMHTKERDEQLRQQAARLQTQQPPGLAHFPANKQHNNHNNAQTSAEPLIERHTPQHPGASSSDAGHFQQKPLRPNSALYNNSISNSATTRATNAAFSSNSYGNGGTIPASSSASSLPSLQSPRPVASVRSLAVSASPARPMSARSLFASSGSTNQPCRLPVGLQNLGNTCFMNAVLQSLFASEPFISYFLDGSYRRDTPAGLSPLTAAFVRLLDNVWGPGSKGASVVAPDAVKSQLGRKNPIFQGYAQQDSHELLRIFLDDIHEELCRAKQPCPFSFDDGKEHERSISENASRMWQNFLARNGSIVSDLFTGQFCSTVVCGTCGYTSRCFDPFMDLSVPLPKAPAPAASWSFFGGSGGGSSSKNADLMDCFNILFGQEELSGADAWYLARMRTTICSCANVFSCFLLYRCFIRLSRFCAKCKKDRTATKKLSLMRIPALLVVHLKRFEGGRVRRTKLNTHITFPIKVWHRLN